MADTFYGRLYLSKIPKGEIELDDRGRKYINILFYEKKDIYGNDGYIALKKKVDKPRIYISNLKKFKDKNEEQQTQPIAEGSSATNVTPNNNNESGGFMKDDDFPF